MISTWVDFCVDCTCSRWGWGGVEGLTVVPAVSGGWGGGSDGCTCSKWEGGAEGLTVVPAVSGGWGGGSDGCTCSKWGVGRRV